MGFPRQEYWSGLLFPSPEELPKPGNEPRSPALGGRFLTAKQPGKPLHNWVVTNHKPLNQAGSRTSGSGSES